jgi:hypothetical protein
MRVHNSYSKKFAIEPSAIGGYSLYRWKVTEFNDYDGTPLPKKREEWDYISHYKSLRQCEKYIKHLAQPTKYVEVT